MHSLHSTEIIQILSKELMMSAIVMVLLIIITVAVDVRQDHSRNNPPSRCNNHPQISLRRESKITSGKKSVMCVYDDSYSNVTNTNNDSSSRAMAGGRARIQYIISFLISC